MEKTTLYLPEVLHGELRALARRTGRPQAELIREALTDYIARQDRPWPTSIGSIADGTLRAADAKDWVRERWRSADERRMAERRDHA